MSLAAVLNVRPEPGDEADQSHAQADRPSGQARPLDAQPLAGVLGERVALLAPGEADALQDRERGCDHHEPDGPDALPGLRVPLLVIAQSCFSLLLGGPVSDVLAPCGREREPGKGPGRAAQREVANARSA